MIKIEQRPVNPEIERAFSHLHPVIARVLAARDVTDESQLELSLGNLLGYQLLKDIESAAARVARAVCGSRPILIIGDFDADGATSTALAVHCLRSMGASQVDFLVPNRFEFGYGLTPEIVEVASRQSPDLIITVDNGIASIEGVAAARQAGIDVVITDHHLAGEKLPDAAAIVNPNQPGCTFSAKGTAGVGVIFYLMCALRQQLRDSGWFDRQSLVEPVMADYLDLVALGTVADVVPLEANNRILVEQGLRRMKAGRLRPGIQALIEVANRQPEYLVSSDLGFALGPRLNAAGRLDDMSLGINLLLSEDINQARRLAAQLDQLNGDRKQIEQEMKEEALALLEDLEVDTSMASLSLFQPHWHQGVVGILASRIKDLYHRPVVVFAQAEPGILKGSARSVAGFHMRDALDLLAKRHPTILSRFGGHAMAAGLTLAEHDFPVFSQALADIADEWLSPEDRQMRLMTDGEMTANDLNLDLAMQLKNLMPWGQGFPEPQFEGRFRLLSSRIVGEKHLKMQLMTASDSNPIDAIWFFMDPARMPETGSQVDLVYQLDVNRFRGDERLQLLVRHLQHRMP